MQRFLIKNWFVEMRVKAEENFAFIDIMVHKYRLGIIFFQEMLLISYPGRKADS